MGYLRVKAAFACCFRFAAVSLSLSDTSLRERFSREGEDTDVGRVDEVEDGEEGRELSDDEAIGEIPRERVLG